MRTVDRSGVGDNISRSSAGRRVAGRTVDVRLSDLASWCQENLGSAARQILFRAGHLSAVRGVRLADGREVVVKVRRISPRIAACVEVQRNLHASGFPCPEPIAGPSAFAPPSSFLATAEEYVPGGAQLDPATADRPALFAKVLSDMVDIGLATSMSAKSRWVTTALDPPHPWAWPDPRALWPVPDDLDADLNVEKGPEWLDELGMRVHSTMLSLATSMPPVVVAHADFDSENIRWTGTANSRRENQKKVHVVHDWDSVAALPEPVIAGLASSVFTMTGDAGTEATVEESELFLDAYRASRVLEWSVEEVTVAWAAGLWVRAFDAKKAFVRGDPAPAMRLRAELPERIKKLLGE
jgi:hypothetical protein